MSVTIRVFDPALCCSTGVCGPSIDPDLARFAADVDWAPEAGCKCRALQPVVPACGVRRDAHREGGSRARNRGAPTRARRRAHRCGGFLPVAPASCRLRVVTDEPAARLELLHKNIRKFGTITNTLAAACELTGEIEVVPPRGAT